MSKILFVIFAVCAALTLSVFSMSNSSAAGSCGKPNKPPCPTPTPTPAPDTSITRWVDHDSTSPIDEDGSGDEGTDAYVTVTNASSVQWRIVDLNTTWSAATSSFNPIPSPTIRMPADGVEHTLEVRAVSGSTVDTTPATAKLTMCPSSGCVSPEPTPTPTPSPEPTPTPTPEPTPTPTPDPSGGPCDDATLFFCDDFNGTNGASPDLTKWSLYNSVGHAGNGLRRPEQCTLDGAGNLRLTAEAKDYNGALTTWSCGMSTRWGATSGGIGSTKYGTVEARVRTEQDPSLTMSAVLIMWPDGGTENDGELDYYETGHSTVARNPFYAYFHYPFSSSQARIIHNADGSEWHTMKMVWGPDRIDSYRDGVLIGSLTGSANIPQINMHPTAQLDAFKSAPIPAPTRMYVDYIRVWK